MEGWPDQPDSDQELAPYVQRRLELGVEGGCLLWGCRVVVPPRGRKRALQMLHESHPGMVRMKALARSYVVARDGQRDRTTCEAMFRLSDYPERPATSSTPPLDLA